MREVPVSVADVVHVVGIGYSAVRRWSTEGRAVGGLTFYVHYRVVSFHAPCCAPLLPLFVVQVLRAGQPLSLCVGSAGVRS
jgi:hypothetical protein